MTLCKNTKMLTIDGSDAVINLWHDSSIADKVEVAQEEVPCLTIHFDLSTKHPMCQTFGCFLIYFMTCVVWTSTSAPLVLDATVISVVIDGNHLKVCI